MTATETARQIVALPVESITLRVYGRAAVEGQATYTAAVELTVDTDEGSVNNLALVWECGASDSRTEGWVDHRDAVIAVVEPQLVERMRSALAALGVSESDIGREERRLGRVIRD